MGNFTKQFSGGCCEVTAIISDANWLESLAVDQLINTAKLPGMLKCVGLPDLHPGKGQPIGAAFISENIIYPHLVGSDIGCGMGLFKLAASLRKVKLDKWERRLIGLDTPEQGASFHLDESLNIPKALIQNIGTIGGGNHFAEIQTVNDVFETSMPEPLGIEKNAVFLLVHSGSRGIGQWILNDHFTHMGAEGLSVGAAGESQYFHQYMARHNFAENWAKENRKIISERFCEKLGVDGNVCLDVSHNHVHQLAPADSERFYSTKDKNKTLFIHRKGATPAHRGLVVIPGSRGTLSYLVRPNIDNINAMTAAAFSLAHGAGRKWQRSQARGRLENKYAVSDLEKNPFGGRVICQSRDLLYEEAPQAYKNIDRVVADLVGAGLVTLVASFKPLLTYKTRRK